MKRPSRFLEPQDNGRTSPFLFALAIAFAAVTSSSIAQRIDNSTTETPSRASAFIDSVGVNTHFDQSPYKGVNFASVRTLLVSLGIRHIRDGSNPDAAFVQRLNSFADTGIRATIITGPTETDSYLRRLPAKMPRLFEAYEGPNEPNNHGPADWAPTTRAFMQRLYTATRGQTPSYPIVAPALVGGPNAARQLGDLNNLIDYGNMHDYLGSANPGTTGCCHITLLGMYGSLGYNVAIARLISGSKPIIATETGYGSTPTGGADDVLDYATAARYLPRLLFTQYNSGIARTFLYELLDQDDSGRKYTNFGLVDTQLRPKPAYLVIQKMLAELQDNAFDFAPKPLTYKLETGSSLLQHTLLQKSDGTYELALWLETARWHEGVPQAVPSEDVTLTLTDRFPSVSIIHFGDAGNASVEPAQTQGSQQIHIRINDSITIVRLRKS